MSNDFTLKARVMLEIEEGKKSMLYRCPMGKWTGGIGHNFTDKPISENVISALFNEDLIEASFAARDIFGGLFFEQISDNRRLAIINMIFNLGKSGFLSFRNTIQAMKEKRWRDAADGVRQSLYAGQVPRRAERIAKMLELDVWPY